MSAAGINRGEGRLSTTTAEVDARETQGESRREVIVVGGGQAGLAMGYFLREQERDFTILEAATEPAAAWKARWDSLTLFTPVRYSSLPGRPFPGRAAQYPTRDEVADYLSDYAARFDLPVELGRRVRSISRSARGYILDTAERTYEAEQVVVATGPFQVPFVPAIASALDPEVTQLHSSSYRSPEQIGSGRVLVVGGGNTGFQIAGELARTYETYLAIGSRQMPLPQRIFGRDLFWYLERTGAIRKTRSSRIGRSMEGRETLIGSRPRALRRQGVRLHPRAVDAAGRTVEFADGDAIEPETLIWATGYRADHSWIDAPVFDESGRVAHERGVTALPGLYLLGLSWLHTRGSALIGWVGNDAQYLGDKIATFSERHRNAEAARAA